MNQRSIYLALASLAVLLTVAACDDAGVEPGDAFASSVGESSQGVTPHFIDGGFDGDAAVVCADPRLNPDGEAWTGIAVTPASAGLFAGFTVTLDRTGRYLGWATPTANPDLMRAVVVEGAYGAYAYDYAYTLQDIGDQRAYSDAGLRAPGAPGVRSAPDISRYVICYAPESGGGGGTSGQGVTPRFVPGNLSGGAAAVCADTRVNPDGEAWLGVKVAPASTGTHGGFAVTLDGPGHYLDWEALGANVMEAVVVKGGPNTHVYDYNLPLLFADTALRAPDNNGGNVPEIGHFVICYTEASAFQGCGQGYWRHNTASWVGYDTNQAVGSVFDGAEPYEDTSLLDALSLQGGPGVDGAKRTLLRQAVAALLNAAHPDVDFPRTPAEVVAAVNAALGTNDRPTILVLADELEAENSLGCPLD